MFSQKHLNAVTISSDENDLENYLSHSIEELEKCSAADDLPGSEPIIKF